MATLVHQHVPEDFAPILAELQRKRIPNNFDRAVAGHGRSQAFGVIRRWSYRPWLSRTTWMRPELWSALLDFAEKFVQVEWDAVQVNDNYLSAPHRDKGNMGSSYIVGFGDYVGGDLVVAGESCDIRHRGYEFNGSELLHSTAPWVGQRYSLVFFRIEWPTKWPRYTVSCRVLGDGLEVTDQYDESIVVLDTKGRIAAVLKAGKQMPWIGRLTARGQPSRVAVLTTEQPDFWDADQAGSQGAAPS